MLRIQPMIIFGIVPISNGFIQKDHYMHEGKVKK